MVKINYSQLHFEHIVTFNHDNTIFVCCRENGNARTRLFLVFNVTGHVYTRNGHADSWELLGEEDATTIKGKITQATQDGVPAYQVNGSSKIATGEFPVAG